MSDSKVVNGVLKSAIRSLSGWNTGLPNKRNRKVVFVCLDCHIEIHNGKYDGRKVESRLTGEPYDKFGGGFLEKRLY